MDQPNPDEVAKLPTGPNLLWTPQIEAEVDTWIRTGIFPFPEMHLSYDTQFRALAKTERRLIHHVGSIYKDLYHRGLLNSTLWVDKLPIFFDLSYNNDFVMSAILAFSATHLASETKSIDTRNLAYHHRGTALNGLHTTISNFNQANSDPILAASLLLSWQTHDWKGWLSLIQGINSVLSSMAAWRDVSILANFVERHVSSNENFYMPPGMGSLMSPMAEDDQSLRDSISALSKLMYYVSPDPQLHQFVSGILQNAQDIETCSQTQQHEQLFEQLFEKLQPLRMRLLWTPIHLVQTTDHSSYNLLTVANLYATAMAIDISLPELQGAAFGALATSAVQEIDRILTYNTSANFDAIGAVEDLLAFPRRIMARTRQKRGSFESTASHARQGSPYSFHNLHSDSGPTTPAFPPQYPNWMQNISTEDLSNLSVPPSPFLDSYIAQGSRPHSALLAHQSRPNSMNFDRRSFSAFSGIGPGDSPVYSPAAANSPVPSVYLEDDASFYNEHVGSWGGANAFPPFDPSNDKNKSSGLSWQGTPPPM